MAIKDFPNTRRYNVRLELEDHGITVSSQTWRENADRIAVSTALLEMMILKEQKPDEYRGKIVIEDADSGAGQGGVQDYRNRRNERVQGPGGDQPLDIGNFAHSAIERLRSPQAAEKSYAQRQLEDSSMVGVCCSDPAVTHSKLWPFKCRALGCRCQGWDSGE